MGPQCSGGVQFCLKTVRFILPGTVLAEWSLLPCVLVQRFVFSSRGHIRGKTFPRDCKGIVGFHCSFSAFWPRNGVCSHS